jgi:hypothetical protein
MKADVSGENSCSISTDPPNRHLVRVQWFRILPGPWSHVWMHIVSSVIRTLQGSWKRYVPIPTTDSQTYFRQKVSPDLRYGNILLSNLWMIFRSQNPVLPVPKVPNYYYQTDSYYFIISTYRLMASGCSATLALVRNGQVLVAVDHDPISVDPVWRHMVNFWTGMIHGVRRNIPFLWVARFSMTSFRWVPMHLPGIRQETSAG